MSCPPLARSLAPSLPRSARERPAPELCPRDDPAPGPPPAARIDATGPPAATRARDDHRAAPSAEEEGPAPAALWPPATRARVVQAKPRAAPARSAGS